MRRTALYRAEQDPEIAELIARARAHMTRSVDTYETRSELNAALKAVSALPEGGMIIAEPQREQDAYQERITRETDAQALETQMRRLRGEIE